MRIIDSMSEDPAEDSANYKKAFDPCCDVPQSGCGCGNCNANPKLETRFKK